MQFGMLVSLSSLRRGWLDSFTLPREASSGSHWNDLWTSEGGYEVLVPFLLAASSHWPLSLCIFHLRKLFQFSSRYLVYRGSVEIDWSSVDAVSCWFPNDFADARGHDMVGAVVRTQKRDVSWGPAADRQYAAWTFVWKILSAGRCSLTSSIAYKHSPSLMDFKVTDPPPVSLSIPSFFDIDLDAEGKPDCRI